MRKLYQLMHDNCGKQPQSSVQANAGKLDVYIYDVIGDYYGAVDTLEIVKAIRAHTGDLITVYINSPGGDVFDAVSIASALRESPAAIAVQVDGYAASAASTIAMAGDTITIAQGGFFMIHNAWTMGIGNRHEMLSIAAMLEDVDASIAATYQAKTGVELSEITAMMDAETWITAERSVELGFANSIIGSSAKNLGFNLCAYEHAPAIENAQPEGEPEPEFAKLRQQLSERLSLIEKLKL